MNFPLNSRHESQVERRRDRRGSVGYARLIGQHGGSLSCGSPEELERTDRTETPDVEMLGGGAEWVCRGMNPTSAPARIAWLAAALWLSAVPLLGYFGWTEAVPTMLRGPLVAAGILLPFLAYLLHRPTRELLAGVPDSAIVALHSWRALAGFAFLYCGERGLLPPTFVRNAGFGDLAVAALVPLVLILPESRRKYLWFHIAGFADFALAVGTGLYFTALVDPLMDNLFSFPLVVIPWLGVGLSGASHLIALHRLSFGGDHAAKSAQIEGVFVPGAANFTRPDHRTRTLITSPRTGSNP